MTLTTLQPYLDSSVATKTANAVLHRVFAEIKSLANPAECTPEWIANSLNILRFSADIEVGFAHSKATMLAIIKQQWENTPIDFRKTHGFAFINFAKQWTGGKAQSTIDAYILTAKLWILDDFGKGKLVSIKKRAADGKPIRNEYGAEIRETVEFCPYAVELSKLGILNPRAQKNDMTETLWEMLVDPFFTCDDLRAEHTKDAEDGNGHQYTLSYGLQGPMLVVYQNGNAVEIAEMNWENYETDPLVKEAINQVLRVLNVQMDEDRIFDMIRQVYR